MAGKGLKDVKLGDVGAQELRIKTENGRKGLKVVELHVGFV